MPRGKIRYRENHYMFYNDKGIGDLVLSLIKPEPGEFEVTYKGKSFHMPRRPQYAYNYLEIETLSGVFYMGYIINSDGQNFNIAYSEL